uniref:Uncharacterized protein n=1 Tax=Zea mays TaxID=4577 RepID=B6U2C8_MAIZE|nr:hypothetical protein [Zea mays]
MSELHRRRKMSAGLAHAVFKSMVEEEDEAEVAAMAPQEEE